jgi:hypothetical protein
MKTRPLKHSGSAGHRATAPRTAAAGQPALLVAIPYTDAVLAAALAVALVPVLAAP